MMKVHELHPDEYCRTSRGRYLYHVRNLVFRDELGSHTCLQSEEYDDECEILPEWPRLCENEHFMLAYPDSVRKYSVNPPDQVLLFCTARGFRFRVKLNRYRITIPFWFASTDRRVGRAQAEWTHDSGRVVPHLFGKQLQLTFDDKNQPLLLVGLDMCIPKKEWP